jgi:hypothetical protein
VARVLDCSMLTSSRRSRLLASTLLHTDMQIKNCPVLAGQRTTASAPNPHGHHPQGLPYQRQNPNNDSSASASSGTPERRVTSTFYFEPFLPVFVLRFVITNHIVILLSQSKFTLYPQSGPIY